METTEKNLVFIVDDNPAYAKMLNTFLLKAIPNLKTKIFSTGEACLHEMYLSPMAIVLDYYLDAKFEYAWNGIQILKKLLSKDPALNVIVISAQENIEIALNCIKEGAIEYIIKNEKTLPEIQKLLLNVIDDAVEY